MAVTHKSETRSGGSLPMARHKRRHLTLLKSLLHNLKPRSPMTHRKTSNTTPPISALSEKETTIPRIASGLTINSNQ
jgi:hypothetical protein